MCAWLRFVGLITCLTVIIVLCPIIRYLRSFVTNMYIGCAAILLLTLIVLFFLPTGVQNPGFGRVHTTILNPSIYWVHFIPLNPDLGRVHSLFIVCDL
jgi:hypothetical protein